MGLIEHIPNAREQVRRTIEELYRCESGRILATLVRLLGDLDLAEETMQEAFAVALHRWPQDGIPEKPRPWLVSTARFKAIDAVRRRVRFSIAEPVLAESLQNRAARPPDVEDEIEDDRLRLIFTCCHPALSSEAQVALTLREVCGLTTEEISKAFLVTPATIAQRIVRAKTFIREQSIPYHVPQLEELGARLSPVLQVIYLIFNEGYSTGASEAELSREAIRLGRLLVELLSEPEVKGLLGLMLLHDARRASRSSQNGDLIMLEHQDRSLWDRSQILEGVSLIEQALTSRRFGPYTLQGAIVAVHAEAATSSDTDWHQIVLLYDRLLRVQPSSVIELNRSVAVAMAEGLEEGLSIVETLLERKELANYHLAHSSRAELCSRLGRITEARVSYEKALSLAPHESERRFLKQRIEEI